VRCFVAAPRIPSATPAPTTTIADSGARITVELLLAPPILLSTLHAVLLDERAPSMLFAADSNRQGKILPAFTSSASPHCAASFISSPFFNVLTKFIVVAMSGIFHHQQFRICSFFQMPQILSR
jgi:hypothetical protein